LLPNPLPFETESIDTNIAMVRRIRQKLSKNYCFSPPFSDDATFLAFFLLKIKKNDMACLSCPSSIEMCRPLLTMKKFWI